MNAILAITMMLMGAGATMILSTVIVSKTICKETMRPSTQQYLHTIGAFLILLGIIGMMLATMSQGV